MRVPEHSSVGTWAALLALGGALAAGCSSPPLVEVAWDQREDLTRFRTWDWIDGDALFVRSPAGDEAELKVRLPALLESGLRERGIHRESGGGELRVAALMVGTRTFQMIRRARAVQTLHSYHDIGGFEVQGEELVRRPVDRCRIAIFVTGPRQERILWRAMSEQRYSDGCARHLDDTVSMLLAGYPPKPPERAAPGSR